MSSEQTIAVFGGTGFLGRRIVSCLERRYRVRVISRHPERARAESDAQAAPIKFVRADVNDDSSVRPALTGTFGAVNAVSLYVEHGDQTFRSVHVAAAARVARIARECGATRFLHVSGVGADPHSRSPYIRSRGEGEEAVRAAFPEATIVRPCVMFGRDDSFLTPLVGLLRRSPVFPLFGRGRTMLQPSHVEDVAEGIARVFEAPAAAPVYEFGGADKLSYEQLLRTIAAHIGAKRIFIPMPFMAWYTLAFCSEMLPRPPLTRNQVDLMQINNVASARFPGLRDLGIEPQSIERVLVQIS